MNYRDVVLKACVYDAPERPFDAVTVAIGALTLGCTVAEAARWIRRVPWKAEYQHEADLVCQLIGAEPVERIQ